MEGFPQAYVANAKKVLSVVRYEELEKHFNTCNTKPQF